jgi:hypothetical protein
MLNAPGASAGADGGSFEADAAARELDDDLRSVMDVERAQDGADVNLDRPFVKTQVAADELVRLALYQ